MHLDMPYRRLAALVFHERMVVFFIKGRKCSIVACRQLGLHQMSPNTQSKRPPTGNNIQTDTNSNAHRSAQVCTAFHEAQPPLTRCWCHGPSCQTNTTDRSEYSGPCRTRYRKNWDWKSLTEAAAGRSPAARPTKTSVGKRNEYEEW